MARHGQNKSQKRISLGTAIHIPRKEFKWSIKARPGPHSNENSLPLGTAIRNLAKLARNIHETKIILNRRVVSVDGVIRVEKKFPIGLFDVLAFSDLKKQYRVIFDKKGRFVLKEIEAKSAAFKLVKATGKTAAKGKKIQVATNDGRVFVLGEKQKCNIGDTLKISLPEQKILEVFELAQGNLAFVFSGKRTGSLGEILQVLPGTMRRGKLVEIKPREGEEFQTVAENIFVLGKQKAEIEI